ncbi:MAG: PQQ-binding-like beta-propeller repeat protein [Planctomycetaceae bacterium]|nr:PQQ-binding-like beta-propeller repeat protein [Planctomycetaceae bacterium]
MRSRFYVASLVLITITFPLSAADWPAYRGDVGHSGYTADVLPAGLNLQWTHTSAAPAPAWPEPVRERLMMDFDYAAQPVIAGGVMYVGSSSEHTVRAIEMAGGKTRWTFYTEGPVRFAPQVVEGKVYVASDDGMVYCLAATDGKCLWKVRGGPSDHRIIGNEQMIGHWPLRSGLVVVDGTVYFTAGMWPMDGVWLVALKASDGSVISRTQPNADFTPQGYMAATANNLIFPAGRGPICMTDRNGGSFKGIGAFAWIIAGTNAAVTGQGPDKGNENLPGVASPAFRPRAASVTIWSPDMSKAMGAQRGKTVAAVAPDAVYVGGEADVSAMAVPGLAAKWSAPVKDVVCLIASGNAVVAGSDKNVTVLSAKDGKVLWSAPVDGEARGLAVADGKLIVSTTAGKIYCFGAGGAGQVQKPALREPATGTADPVAGQILKDSKLTAGYCLLIGAGDGSLAVELAYQSKLMIYCAEPDEKKVAAAREKLSAAGLYGTRVAVHHVPAGDLPYGDYFANLVVVQQGGFKPAAVGRVLRPYGGAAYALPAVTGQWIEADPLTRGPLAGGIQKAVRGKLPGATEWNHQYADAGNSASSGDANVKWPLQVLWFGKPGPSRIMNRHLRGTAPVTSNGRMFILGQHSIIAADAYNGRELWTRDLPAVQRRVVDIWGGNMVADDDSVYVTTGDLCLRFDAGTGAIKNTYHIPAAQPVFPLAASRKIELDGGASVQIAAAADGLELTLTAPDTKVTNAQPESLPVRGDAWELFFDMRSAQKRDGLYGSGAFHLIVVPASAEDPKPRVASGPLAKAPAVTATALPGTTLVKIAWNDVIKLTGEKPTDFTFGAILNSSDDGKSVNKRTYKFANTASYRLANARALMIVNGQAIDPVTRHLALDKAGPAEQLIWGYMASQGDTIVGSVVAWNDSPKALAHGWDYASEGDDYTGPMVGQVLGIIGLAKESKYIFGVDKKTGAVKWVYAAADVVPHNGIALAADKVYLIDRVSVPEVAAARSRRGRRPPPPKPTPEAPLKGKIKILSLADGKEKSQVDDGLSDYQQLRLGKGILLAASMTGMTAFGAEGDSLKKLWSVVGNQPMHHCSAFVRAPVITGKWVYDEPFAYDIRSGEKRSTGSEPWKWGAGFGGCGTVSASENMLFYRAGNPGLVDTTSTADFHKFVGVRPGCYVNMVAACGLLLMPEASSGCGCPYNFQTTVALSPK